MEYWSEFIILFTGLTAGLVSPGPNFALVLRNSLLLSRRNAMYTVIGLTTATIFQVLAVIFGLGVLVCEVPQTLKIVQFFGGLFLAYLGLQGWGISWATFRQVLSQRQSVRANNENQPSGEVHKGQTVLQSARIGFITSILNPMSFVFYASMFSGVSMATPVGVRLLYATAAVAEFALWFAIVGLFFSNKRIQERFLNYRDLINRITGTVLLYFAYNLIAGAMN